MSVLYIPCGTAEVPPPAPMFKSPPPTIRLTDSRIGIIGEECWRLAQAELDPRDYSELVRTLIGETDAICAEAAEMGHVGLVELRS